MKKRNLLIAAGVVAAGVCIWLIARPSKGPKVLLETAPISHITIRNSVTATGTVEPVTQVEVGTQVSGIIDKLYADYNDQVKAGQLIAEMDKVTLQAELESAQAQLASSKTEYEYQTKNYARTKTLHEKQLVSDAEYDQAFYLYETARNAYEQSQAAMVKVKRNLGYATITSPIDGVVISRAVEEGQTVAAGFETPTLFTIANDLTQMQVVADVDEADIGQVADDRLRHQPGIPGHSALQGRGGGYLLGTGRQDRRQGMSGGQIGRGRAFSRRRKSRGQSDPLRKDSAAHRRRTREQGL